jgi:hypothetical protein
MRVDRLHLPQISIFLPVPAVNCVQTLKAAVTQRGLHAAHGHERGMLSPFCSCSPWSRALYGVALLLEAGLALDSRGMMGGATRAAYRQGTGTCHHAFTDCLWQHTSVPAIMPSLIAYGSTRACLPSCLHWLCMAAHERACHHAFTGCYPLKPGCWFIISYSPLAWCPAPTLLRGGVSDDRSDDGMHHTTCLDSACGNQHEGDCRNG